MKHHSAYTLSNSSTCCPGVLAIQSVCVFTIDYTILTFGLVLHTPGYSPVFIPSPIALDEIVGEIETSWAFFIF